MLISFIRLSFKVCRRNRPETVGTFRFTKMRVEAGTRKQAIIRKSARPARQ